MPESLPQEITTAQTNITSINQKVALISGLQAPLDQQISSLQNRISSLTTIANAISVAPAIVEVNRLLNAALQFRLAVDNDRFLFLQGTPQLGLSDANKRLQEARSNLSQAQQREATILSRSELGGGGNTIDRNKQGGGSVGP